MGLSSRDYKAILDIIDIAYSVQDRAAMFQAICEKLEKLIGISSAVFFPMDSDTGHFRFKDHLRFNSPIQSAFLFTVYYAPLHPLAQCGKLNTDMRAQKTIDFISAPKLVDTEYGHDFLPLTPYFYDLGSVVRSQGDLLGAIGLHRQRRDRDFTERHRTILNLLLPHLSRALHNLD